MAAEEDALQSPQTLKRMTPKQAQREGMFSPRFRSLATMAGWDEEAILMATLVVEDTPDQEHHKHKKRSHIPSKSPPLLISRSKRRAHRSLAPTPIPTPTPIPLLNLEEEEKQQQKTVPEGREVKIDADEGKRKGEELTAHETSVSGSDSVLPCMDRLREELSCAICLEICFEPSTTSCGHSFCKKCLKSAAEKCGKRCPKCRQLISNGRSCNVNTVLWNTIQLLFADEVRERQAAMAACDLKSKQRSLSSVRRSTRFSSSSRGDASWVHTRRRGVVVVPSQDGDAALALRLQREEFMGAFRDGPAAEFSNNRSGNSSNELARANLRALASRAYRLRASRGRAI